MEALQEMIDKALKENSDLLNEKEQLEETQRETEHILQDFETKNTELWVFYNEVKDNKNEPEEEKEKLEKICRDIEWRSQEVVTKNSQ